MKPFAIATILFLAVFSLAQDKPQTLVPNELQALKLKNRQLQAQVSFYEMQAAQAKASRDAEAFFNECEAVKTENTWDKGATCNLNSADAIEITAPPAKKEEAKPVEKKP